MPRLSVDLGLVFPDHGMPRIQALAAIGDRMMREMQSTLHANERQFLLSLVANQPDWSLLKIHHAQELPGVRWKLHNLGQLQKSQSKEVCRAVDSPGEFVGFLGPIA